MRANKYTIYFTAIISVITLIICIIFYPLKSIIYDLSLACFGSALLGMIVSLTTYYAVRREAMEMFWNESLLLVAQIRKINHIQFDEPIEIIKECLSDEYGYNIFESKKYEGINKLKNWIEENRIPNDGKEDYDVSIEKYCHSIIHNYKNELVLCAKIYLDISKLDIRSLNNAYGNMDFLFGNKYRNKTYNEIYKEIYNIREACREEALNFKLLSEERGNICVCLEKIIKLNKKVFSINGEKVFNSLADRIDENLEVFRSKMYFEKPSEFKPCPVNWVLDFENIDNTVPKNSIHCISCDTKLFEK